MAKYTGPVLKKCRALGISPMELGIDKKSNRQVKVSRKKKQNINKKNRQKFGGFLKKHYICTYEGILANFTPIRPSIQKVSGTVNPVQYPVCGIEHLFVCSLDTNPANPVQSRWWYPCQRVYALEWRLG